MSFSRYLSKLGTLLNSNGQVLAGGVADGSISTTKIADANVTASKLASGVSVSNIGYTPVNKAGDTLTGDLTLPDGVAASRSTIFNNSATVSTNVNRAIGYSTAWTDHLSVNITLSKPGPVCVSALFANFYESGAVDGWAYVFISSGNSSYAYSIGQQGTANMGMGSHSLMHIFGNIPAGTYTVTLRVQNLGSGSNWILNNYIGYDGLYVMY
jgi:hypothetical protein